MVLRETQLPGLILKTMVQKSCLVKRFYFLFVSPSKDLPGTPAQCPKVKYINCNLELPVTEVRQHQSECSQLMPTGNWVSCKNIILFRKLAMFAESRFTDHVK